MIKQFHFWDISEGNKNISASYVHSSSIYNSLDMGNRWGNSGNSVRLYFWGAPKSLQMVTAAMKLKDAYFLEEKI